MADKDTNIASAHNDDQHALGHIGVQIMSGIETILHGFRSFLVSVQDPFWTYSRSIW
jgi:hypothetical protein